MLKSEFYRQNNWQLVAIGLLTLILWNSSMPRWLPIASLSLFLALAISRLIVMNVTKIDADEVGVVDDSRVVKGPKDVWSDRVQYIKPDERILTIGPNIIRWIPDLSSEESVMLFARRNMDEGVVKKFTELLNANPAVDLADFEEPLGIKIIRQSGKIPTEEKTEGTVVGKARDGKLVTIRPESRTQHTLVIGKTGTGKSTLMLNMIRQDMEQGKGLAVVEPGDLVRDILKYIPANRHADVLYFDFDHPLPIDVFETRSEEERETLAEDIITTFRRFFESSQWGMGMDTILRFTVLALGQFPQATFLDIYKFLADESFRSDALDTNANPTISHFWQKEFPKNPTFKSSVTGINSRMAKFVTSTVLQNTLGTKRGAIDFSDLVSKKRILLVNVRGGEAGSVIGSLIVSKIQQTAMRRKENRVPFYLYADEFQNYTTSAFNVIFTEARKYELGMTLATQLLSNVSTNIRDNILQAGTAITFKSDEGNVFKNRLGDFEPKDVATLPEYHAILMGTRWTGEIQTLSAPSPTSSPFIPKVSVGATLRTKSPTTARSDFDDDIRPSPEPAE